MFLLFLFLFVYLFLIFAAVKLLKRNRQIMNMVPHKENQLGQILRAFSFILSNSLSLLEQIFINIMRTYLSMDQIGQLFKFVFELFLFWHFIAVCLKPLWYLEVAWGMLVWDVV